MDTFIGKTLGYGVQDVAYAKIADALNPQSVILIRTGAKYGSKIFRYTAKNYVRADFKTETIFSDAIDASFFADSILNPRNINMKLTFTFHDAQEISSSAYRRFISTFHYQSDSSDFDFVSDNSDSELSDFDLPVV